MEKEKDFFASIPTDLVYLAVAGVALLMMIGAIRRWKWVLDMTGQHTGILAFLNSWFGEDGVRIGTIILWGIVILCMLLLHFINV